jgi:hypothetical protein
MAVRNTLLLYFMEVRSSPLRFVLALPTFREDTGIR